MRAKLILVGTIAAALFGATSCGLNANDPYRDLPVVSLDDAPPPISGGTLAASPLGHVAVASDPDRDRVLVVDLDTERVRVIETARDAEPGRVVLTSETRAFVVQRRAGSLLELDVERAVVVAEHAVCPSPRGLAWDDVWDSGELHVACADGALVTFGTADGAVTELARLQLDPDLRDVVVTTEGVLVSRFRSAEVVLVDGGATFSRRLPDAELEGITQGGLPSGLSQRYEPSVAVRMTSTPTGAMVLHQRARVGVEAVFRAAPRPARSYTYSSSAVENDRGDVWRDPCGNAVVHSAATVVGATGYAHHVALPISHGVVPVDVAVSAGGRVAVAFAGEPGGELRFGPQVFTSSLAASLRDLAEGCLEGSSDGRYDGQAIAVAFAGERALVQLREPARLVVEGTVIELGGESVRDTGHEVFHLDTGGGIACASCHPEGGDDGHVWTFSATGAVRTQSLEGAVGLVPYHRRGDVASFPVLIDTLQEQMAGPRLSREIVAATERWLARLPSPPAGPSSDLEAIERGRVIFERADVGCATCHAGELGTDGLSHEVGGSLWQTPPLRGVALRAPYMHDGSAATLGAALAAGVEGHAQAASLDAAELADLEAYVRAR